MKLVSARVTNFRCTDDSDEFTLSDITCLVGKNESGKTTILQALAGLRPYDKSRQGYNKTRDYPRRYLAEFDDRHGDGDARVMWTMWRLDAADTAAVEDVLGQGCLAKDAVGVSKGILQEGTTWEVGLNKAKVTAGLVEQAGCSSAEKEELKGCGTTKKLLAALDARTEPLSHALTALKDRVEGFRDGDAELEAIDILSARMPNAMYFSNYDKMSGDISVEKLREDIKNKRVSEGDTVFLNFLKYAGTTLDELANTNQFEEMNAKLESASIRITKQIFEYWSQNRHLKVQVKLDAARSGDPAPFNTGTVIRARIYNTIHEMTVPFSERSAGFVWFFSFLVMFSQVTKLHGNVLILLDEPGLNLHAKAQGDLLRFFDDKLRPNHQVVYTTHSPFMVPASDLSSVRTVEDVVVQRGPYDYDSKGTKVGGEVLSTDRDTLFPLQAALGYEITQSLFVGEHTLLVEGPGEILYFQAVSAELEARGRKGLDRRWTPCPSNGVDKVQAFLSLFGGNKLHCAVLVDLAKGQKAKVNELKKLQTTLLKEGHVFTVADFTGGEEADIEDMFGPGLYASFVNGAYSLTGNKALTTESLMATEAKGGSQRLALKAEAAVNAVLPMDAKEFSHYPPARWLIQQPDVLRGDGQEVLDTLGRFEKMFAAFNRLLA